MDRTDAYNCGVELALTKLADVLTELGKKYDSAGYLRPLRPELFKLKLPGTARPAPVPAPVPAPAPNPTVSNVAPGHERATVGYGV